MFATIYNFELSYWIKNPLVYVFGAALFAIPFLTMWGMSAEANVGDNITMMNSYYKINNMANMFALILIFLLPAIVGNSIFRDYKSRYYTLLYSFPFTKGDYLSAKFLSAFTVVILIVCLLAGGFLLGSLMPGVQEAAMLPFDVFNYLHLIFVFLIPNMLFFGALVFALVLYTRNIYISFIGVIFMVIIQSFAKGVLGVNGWDMTAAICDPTGDASIKYIVRYWTLEERNFNALPISGPLLYNRLFWLCITMLIFAFSYFKFEFNQFVNTSSKHSKASHDKEVIGQKVTFISLPSFQLHFSWKDHMRTAWHLSNMDFRSIVFTWPFQAILFAGGVLVLFQQYQMGPQDGVISIPTTSNMLRFPVFFFSAIVNLLTFLYAGVLIHRDRLYRMSGMIDSTPQPDWVFLLSKLLALVKVHFVLLALILFGGILAQVVGGYYRFEIGHYLFELYVLQLIHFFAWACLALCVHSVFSSMYLGYFVLILVPVANLLLPQLGDYLKIDVLKENLLQFNSVRGIFVGFDYSDFNGYGSQLVTYFTYKFYWTVCSIGLMIISLLVWKRGQTFTISERWDLVRSKCQGALKYSFFLGFLFFIATGFMIYHQEHNVSKVMFFDKDMKDISAQNEIQYGHLEGILQPKLCDVNMTMDIYPKQQDFVAKGIFTYVNKVDQLIDTIVIGKSFKEQTKSRVLAPHTVLADDDILKYHIVKLEKGLALGDSVSIELEITNHRNSFLHHNSRAISNGSYITAHILPKLGFKDILLTNNKDRKKYGLEALETAVLLPSDTTLTGYEYGTNNMGMINYTCTMSTSVEQQAYTLGTIHRQWTKDGRTYTHFQSKGPIVNSLAWMSGIYEQKKSTGRHQAIELNRHPLHGSNDDHFLNGINASLTYCSELFGQLDFDTIRVVEFPETEGTFATVHGNLMPYSESYFKCDVHDSENEVFNVPFFVSAHEIAHCWWGHRIDPANIPGGRMITEGMADYLAMKAIEDSYDRTHVTEIRKRYHELYLEARANKLNETPLIHSDLQNEYLNYRKSALAIYSVSEMIGEANFNKAITRFENDYNTTQPPFPTSLDFVAYIQSETPDSLQYLIHDLFETITLYDNELSDVDITELAEGYQLSLKLMITKYRADQNGKRCYGNSPLVTEGITSLPLSDYVEIGLYNKEEDLIRKERLLINQVSNLIMLSSDQMVHQVRIDPDYLLFDVNRDNDVWWRE